MTGQTPAAPAATWPDWCLPALAGGILYVLTMAPGVLWGDSGDAQVRVLVGGWSDPRDLVRAHVSYYALAIGLYRGLGLSAATAANLVAALAGAVTVANASLLIRLLVPNRTAHVAAVLLLLLSHTLWQLSAGAEVVTLTCAVLLTEVLFVVRFLQTGRRGFVISAALVNGLGWTTHNLALLTWPAYVALLWLNRKRLARAGRTAAAAGLAWVVGAAPLLVLAVQTYLASGDAARTLRSLLVGVYARQVFWHSVGIGQVLRVVGYVIWNFPTPLLLAAPLGWWALRRRVQPAVWLYLTIAGLTYAVFGARYHVADQYTFLVPAYLFGLVFVASGLAVWLARHPSRVMRAAVLACAVTAPAWYAAAPKLCGNARVRAALPVRDIPYRDACRWFLQPWRCGDQGAAAFAREVLAALPPDAVLYADTTTRHPIEYVQVTAGLRPEVHLVDSQARLAAGLPRFQPADVDRYIAAGRLYSVVHEDDRLPVWLARPELALEPSGPVYRVRQRTVAPP